MGTIRNSEHNDMGIHQTGLSHKTVEGYEVGLPENTKVFLLSTKGSTFETSVVVKKKK